MKSLIAYRNPTKLKSLLTFIISITFMIVWLPFLRAIFDGESYHWGTNYFGYMIHGAGVNSDFIFVIIQLLFYVALAFSMYWIQNRKVFYGLLLVWFTNVFGNLLYDIVANGDTMFHGDTLNVHISITWIVVPLSALALILIFFVIKQDIDQKEVSIEWNAMNRNLAYFILGPLVIQAILFAVGEPHATTDEIGVIISLVQNFALPFIVRPYNKSLKVAAA
jgi:hypothetical protein